MLEQRPELTRRKAWKPPASNVRSDSHHRRHTQSTLTPQSHCCAVAQLLAVRVAVRPPVPSIAWLVTTHTTGVSRCIVAALSADPCRSHNRFRRRPRPRSPHLHCRLCLLQHYHQHNRKHLPPALHSSTRPTVPYHTSWSRLAASPTPCHSHVRPTAHVSSHASHSQRKPLCSHRQWRSAHVNVRNDVTLCVFCSQACIPSAGCYVAGQQRRVWSVDGVRAGVQSQILLHTNTPTTRQAAAESTIEANECHIMQSVWYRCTVGCTQLNGAFRFSSAAFFRSVYCATVIVSMVRPCIAPMSALITSFTIRCCFTSD